jgi:hypothetical protein
MRGGCSVIRFPGSSDGDRRSTARNGCATRSEERSPCSPAGLKTRHYNGTLALLAGGGQARRYADASLKAAAT